jgi:hypothetical protein
MTDEPDETTTTSPPAAADAKPASTSAGDTTAQNVADFRQRMSDVLHIRLLGAPAKSAAAWVSAIEKAERDGRPCPTWAELEEIASSLPIDRKLLLGHDE